MYMYMHTLYSVCVCVLCGCRYLTERERYLQERRRTAEEALRRQEELARREQALDQEEREIDSIVNQALQGLHPTARYCSHMILRLWSHDTEDVVT